MPTSHTPVDVDRFTRLTGVSIETAYSLLASSRLRIGLHVLSTAGPEPSLERLAAAVARLDSEQSPSSARISLVHVVLPKLEAHGILEYELRSGTVHLDGPVVDLEDPIGATLDTADGDDSVAPIGNDDPTGTIGGDGTESFDARDSRK